MRAPRHRQLKIKNWAEFQHYKHRSPPWIKLHFDIFTSEDWITVSDKDKLLMCVCMLLASKRNGVISDDPHYIQKVAYLDKLPNLNPLVDCGFFEILQADDSKGKRLRTNAPQSRVETEKSRAEKKETPPNGGAISEKEFILPSWVPKEAWESWLEVRRSKKAPPTQAALSRAVKLLSEARAAGESVEEILEHSIVSNWVGVFRQKQNGNGKESPFEKLDRVSRDIIREYEEETGDHGAHQRPLVDILPASND